VNSGFSRDLNAYRGFAPPQHLVAGGLLAPNWGYTIKFKKGPGGSFQGIYLGAGPYVSLQDDLRFDPKLIAILGSPVNVAVPANSSFYAANGAVQQAAVAITGGYRTKIAFGSSTSIRDGLYLAFNFNYLIGIRQDAPNLNLNIATDSTGLVTANPLSAPLTINYLWSTSGRGFSTDVGMEIVRHGWEFGAGANGIANRIDWRNNHLSLFSLNNLSTGVAFAKTPLAAPAGIFRRELPIQYLANLGYSFGRWTVRTDADYELQKLSTHTGAEYRAGPVALRGGVRYGLEEWNPTGGLGFNFSHRFGIDLGFFGNSTNLERKREVAMAVSFRVEHGAEK